MRRNHVLVGCVLLGAVCLVSSCRYGLDVTQTHKKSEESVSRSILGMGVIQMPTVVDLEVNPKRETYVYSITVISEKLREKEKELQEERYKKKEVDAAKEALEALSDTKERIAESSLDGVKAIAKSKMLIQFEADVLIDPRYSVEVENNEKITVTVSGYLGTYRKFRAMELKDTALVNSQFNIIYPQRTVGEIEVQR